MKGKVVIITGATSGIGKETAISLAKMGAIIVIATRNIEAGEKIKKEIVQITKNNNIDYLQCDLASMNSVRKFCDSFKEKYERLDVLVNNAGTWDFEGRKESEDGIENIFAVNFVAPFLMTHLLLDMIKKSAPSRIINLSSALHTGTINFDDIEFREDWSGFKAYRQSKLAIILFTRKLANDLKDANVTVNCIHPGMVSTKLGRDAGGFSRLFFKVFGKSPKVGAETSIFLASSPDVKKITGEYWSNSKIDKASKESMDMEAAERLWKIGLEYIGVGE